MPCTGTYRMEEVHVPPMTSLVEHDVERDMGSTEPRVLIGIAKVGNSGLHIGGGAIEIVVGSRECDYAFDGIGIIGAIGFCIRKLGLDGLVGEASVIEASTTYSIVVNVKTS